MIAGRFSTEELPQVDRFTWRHDLTVSTLIPTVLHNAQADDFRVSAQILDLGAIQISAMTYLPLTAERTPRLIRQSDPEYCQLSLTVRGSMELHQHGRRTAFGSGDLILYDSSRPFAGRATVEHGSGSSGQSDEGVRQIVAQFPKALLPMRSRVLDGLYATRIPADEGFFQDNDLTVAAWMRNQRLEHARRALTDPTQHRTSVQELAARRTSATPPPSTAPSAPPTACRRAPACSGSSSRSALSVNQACAAGQRRGVIGDSRI